MLGNMPLQAAVILLVHKKGLLTGNGLNRIHKTGMSWFLTGNMYRRTKSEGLKKKLNGHTGEWYSLKIWFPCKELMKIWLYYSVLSTFKSEYAEKIPLDCRAGQWYIDWYFRYCNLWNSLQISMTVTSIYFWS